MNEIQAALGLCVLDILEGARRQRAEVFRMLETALGELPGIRLLKMPQGVCPSYQYFPVLMDREGVRDRIRDKLRAGGIHARRYFYPLCSRIPCYRDRPGAEAGNLPVATDTVEKVLCLPCHHAVCSGDVDRMAEIIGSVRP